MARVALKFICMGGVPHLAQASLDMVESVKLYGDNQHGGSEFEVGCEH